MTTMHPHTTSPGFGIPDRPTTGPDRSSYLRPLCGAEPGGYNTAGDARVTRTLDGVSINDIYAEAQAVMSEWNSQRSKLSALVSYPTTSFADPIAQNIGGIDFEEASEFGIPAAVRSGVEPLLMGYPFKDYDSRSAFTWKFLRDSSAEQVRAYISEAIEGDNRKTTGAVLRRLFDNTAGQNEFGHKIYPLYTGLDGAVPPPFAGQVHLPTASHMLASGNSAIDPGDLLDLFNAVQSKGFGVRAGTRLLIFCHPHEAEIISTFRRGEETNGVESKFDAIASASSPAYLSDANIVGPVPEGEYCGLPVTCGFGPALVIASYHLPLGYVACVASGGANSPSNPLAFREHTDPIHRGLRLLAGNDSRFPLVDAMFGRSFGVGTRYRGAAAVLKVTSGTVYTPPTWHWS